MVVMFGIQIKFLKTQSKGYIVELGTMSFWNQEGNRRVKMEWAIFKFKNKRNLPSSAMRVIKTLDLETMTQNSDNTLKENGSRKNLELIMVQINPETWPSHWTYSYGGLCTYYMNRAVWGECSDIWSQTQSNWYTSCYLCFRFPLNSLEVSVWRDKINI